MAIIPETRFVGKINAASPEYPQGSARDITVPGDATGTPWKEGLINDIWGYLQRMNLDAGVTPDGNPDTVLASQYFESMMILAGSARRNFIIDGRFDFWFEAVSQTASGYGSDTMWVNENVGSTKTHTQETLAAGVDLPSIEVPSAQFFSRTVAVSSAGAGNFVRKTQKVEDVRSLAGKSAILSFYAKADSTKNIAVDVQQGFGSGGSPAVTGILAKKLEVTANWQRFEVAVDIPSIAGATIGGGSSVAVTFYFDAGSSFDGRTDALGQQSGTFDIAAVQLEKGTQATNFEEDGQQESLTRVNRYYEQSVAAIRHSFSGDVTSARSYSAISVFVVPKRAAPAMTVIDAGAATGFAAVVGGIDGTGPDAFRESRTATATTSGSFRSSFTADARL